MADKHVKKCSNSLLIREIQIRTTMRYNYTCTSVDKMKEIDYEKFWQEYEAICSLMHF